MGIKKPKPFPLNGYIFANLRRIWRWHPNRKKAYAQATVGSRFRCAGCKNLFEKKNIAIDHIDPVVPPNVGFTTWDEYIKRLFCDVTNLQVLCKRVCHAAKTKAEGQVRKAAKASRKKAA